MKYLKKISLFLIVFFLITNFQIHVMADNGRSNLSVPQNLRITNVTENQIELKWDPVNYASGYIIYMASPNNKFYRVIARVSSPSFIHTNINPNTDYWYYIRAFNSESTSDPSEKASLRSLSTTSSGKKTVMGYAVYYYAGHMSSYDSINAYSNQMTDVVVHVFSTDGRGNLTGTVPPVYTSLIKQRNLTMLFTVSNNFNSITAGQLLSSPENRKNLINNIVTQIVRHGFDGVNIDLENIPAANRNHYTLFMKELYETLNPSGYLVTAAVQAKTSDDPRFSWVYAFDYKSIAPYCDKIVIMTYDQHYSTGRPGPVASINWVKNVIDYSLTVIPREKIILGLAAYGYDWPPAGTARAYGVDAAYSVAASNNARVMWDEIAKSPYFNYVDANGLNRTVWFENHESIKYKLDIVKEHDLGGVAIWRLGFENNEYWKTINRYF